MINLNIGVWFLILFGGVIFVIIFWKYILKILKLSWVLVLQFVLGLMILFIFNIFGQLINVYIPLNIITAFIAGVFRIPGLIVLIVIKMFIV